MAFVAVPHERWAGRERERIPFLKFQRFGLTPKRAAKVAAPLIAECYANFECRLRDTRMIRTYGLFIWEVVNAHVAGSGICS